jgi:hypothetical protein
MKYTKQMLLTCAVMIAGSANAMIQYKNTAREKMQLTEEQVYQAAKENRIIYPFNEMLSTVLSGKSTWHLGLETNRPENIRLILQPQEQTVLHQLLNFLKNPPTIKPGEEAVVIAGYGDIYPSRLSALTPMLTDAQKQAQANGLSALTAALQQEISNLPRITPSTRRIVGMPTTKQLLLEKLGEIKRQQSILNFNLDSLTELINQLP